MKRLFSIHEAGGALTFAALLFFASLFPGPVASAQEEQARNLDIYPDYNNFLPSPQEGARVSFIDRSSSDLTKFPKLMGPPQCPHEAIRKGLKFPVMGQVDLTLFCAPGDRHSNE
jgi:hypothetical protein